MTATKPSPAFLEPSGREIHVWAVQLFAADDVLDVFESILSPEEIDRKRRLRFGSDRHAFVISRGVLRILLSRYLSIHAEDVRFTYGRRGKPRLANAVLDLRFNSSHCNKIAVYCITLGCELGIDVEQIRPLQEIEAIAHRYFCAEETADLISAPAAERESSFFRCWTRKEAFIKAIGDGLAIPLNSFRVSLKGDHLAELVQVEGDFAAATDWKLHEIIPTGGYICALAYRDNLRSVRVHPLMHANELAAMRAVKDLQE
jgi:4'-phosphopantetheinyl transferase